VDIIEKNTFELDHLGMSSEFAYKFGFKGPVMDAELPVTEIENFLKKHNSTFEMLASEHLKKMDNTKFKSKIQVNEK